MCKIVVLLVEYFNSAGKSHSNSTAEIAKQGQAISSMAVLPFVFSVNSVLTVANSSASFVGHFNAPNLYFELKNRNVFKFGMLTMISFIICGILQCMIAVTGYLRFGNNVQQDYLQSISDTDAMINICRILMVISMGTGY